MHAQCTQSPPCDTARVLQWRLLWALLGTPGNRNMATIADELSNPEKYWILTQIKMHELHAIFSALGLKSDSVIEFDGNEWNATRAAAVAVVIGARTPEGKAAQGLRNKNAHRIRAMAVRMLTCTMAQLVGYCIVCGERLVQKSAATTAASVALLHCPDLMAEQGTKKVVVGEGNRGVIYELGQHHRGEIAAD